MSNSKFILQLPSGEGRPEMSAYGKRDALLAELGFSGYSGYLQSETWKKIRKRYLCGKCKMCETRKATTLHHTMYTKSVLLHGQQNILVPLCMTCHMCLEFSGFGVKNTLEEANEKLQKTLGLPKSMRKRYLKDKKRMQKASFRQTQKIKKAKKVSL